MSAEPAQQVLPSYRSVGSALQECLVDQSISGGRRPVCAQHVHTSGTSLLCSTQDLALHYILEFTILQACYNMMEPQCIPWEEFRKRPSLVPTSGPTTIEAPIVSDTGHKALVYVVVEPFQDAR